MHNATGRKKVHTTFSLPKHVGAVPIVENYNSSLQPREEYTAKDII